MGFHSKRAAAGLGPSGLNKFKQANKHPILKNWGLLLMYVSASPHSWSIGEKKKKQTKKKKKKQQQQEEQEEEKKKQKKKKKKHSQNFPSLRLPGMGLSMTPPVSFLPQRRSLCQRGTTLEKQSTALVKQASVLQF